ncbi:hypothetical protein ACIGXM_25560 [Kitasatospora sp. NPDC052896]|uniref:hypothetical protein n=1 Tax=Kitasatospora sp. NPDC052896 TaxID=3364061 RepID=UPI0037C8DBA1
MAAPAPLDARAAEQLVATLQARARASPTAGALFGPAVDQDRDAVHLVDGVTSQLDVLRRPRSRWHPAPARTATVGLRAAPVLSRLRPPRPAHLP